MIGRTTSPPLPVELPSADGTGVGAVVGTGVAGAGVGAGWRDGRAALGDEAAVDGAAVGTGVGEGVGATATLNVQVPRSTCPSRATEVHATAYDPVPSGVAGVATIRVVVGRIDGPLGDWSPGAVLDDDAAAGRASSPRYRCPETTVTGWVTVDLSAGLAVLSSACAATTPGSVRHGHRTATRTSAAARRNGMCSIMVSSLQTFAERAAIRSRRGRTD